MPSTNQEPAVLLAPILRVIATRIRQRRVVFFLGAGASADAPANLPLAQSLVRNIARHVVCDVDMHPAYDVVERVVEGVRFELVLQALSVVLGASALEPLRALEGGRPNTNHRFVARLLSDGLTPLVLTTNFDSLLEDGLKSFTKAPYDLWFENHHYNEPIRVGVRPRIVKLHGTLRDTRGHECPDSILVAADQVGRRLAPSKARFLRYILERYDIVFIGYSGLDDFDLFPLLLTTRSDRSIWWVRHQSPLNATQVTAAAKLSERDEPPADNAELIVAARRHGALIDASTATAVKQLAAEVYGPSRNRSAGRPSRPRVGVTAITQWASRPEVAENRALFTGLLLEHLEDHSAAAAVLETVPAGSDLAGFAQYHRAVCLRRSGYHVVAARAALEALAKSRTLPQECRARALCELGLLELEQMRIKVGRGHLRRALKLGLSDDALTANAHSNLGMSYLFEAERKRSAKPARPISYHATRAVLHLKKAHRIVGRLGDPRAKANIHGNLGLAYSIGGRFTSAQTQYREALRLFRSLRLRSEEASCLSNIGFMLKERALSIGSAKLRHESLRRALRASLAAHELKLKVSNRRRISLSAHGVGELHWLLKQYDSAVRFLGEALTGFRAEGLQQYEREVSDLLRLAEAQLHAPEAGAKRVVRLARF